MVTAEVQVEEKRHGVVVFSVGPVRNVTSSSPAHYLGS